MYCRVGLSTLSVPRNGPVSSVPKSGWFHAASSFLFLSSACFCHSADDLGAFDPSSTPDPW